MEITLDDADAVYDHYRTHRQPVAKAKALYGWLAVRHRPDVHLIGEAGAQIKALRREHGRAVIISANHVRQSDPFVLAATGFRSPLRPRIGRIRVLAKDGLFQDPEQRSKIDVMGGIPVFRPKDHGIRESMAAGREMIEVCVERMADGDWLAVFPEGTCNPGDPAQLQPLGSGMGHIALGALKNGQPVSLISVGIAYRDETARGASVSISEPVEFDEAARKSASAATRFAAAELQAAVDDATRRL
ncbi:MAG: 1-acyl-sn-glycerol-3-phosphate acyltransferase [Gordonia sp. (in: high G+C Gram-positive bacteria)]